MEITERTRCVISGQPDAVTVLLYSLVALEWIIPRTYIIHKFIFLPITNNLVEK